VTVKALNSYEKSMSSVLLRYSRYLFCRRKLRFMTKKRSAAHSFYIGLFNYWYRRLCSYTGSEVSSMPRRLKVLISTSDSMTEV